MVVVGVSRTPGSGGVMVRVDRGTWVWSSNCLDTSKV